MNKDKITAMWEEDGDLMRIRKFFDYIYQDENLKERIKQKALAKISTSDELSQTGDIGITSQHEDELKQIYEEELSAPKPKRNRNPFTLLSSINNKRGRSILKTFSAAAVLVFAVYLGSTLHDGNVPFTKGLGSAKSAQEDGGFAAPGQNFIASDMDMQSPDVSPQPQFSSASNVSGRESIEMAAEPKEDVAIEQKIIYTLDATLRVENVDTTLELIAKQITSMGGYISESRKTERDTEITAYMTVRIPVESFESFKGELSQYGTVSDQHLNTDDISREYFDVETRLRSWEAQEKRYLEILEQAKTVEEILQIESYLSNVRRELESLKGQLKYWDNRVQYSEVRMQILPIKSNFTVTDPWQPVSITSTILAAKNAIIKSISLIWNAVNYLLVFIGYAIPVAFLLILAWLGYRKFRKG